MNIMQMLLSEAQTESPYLLRIVIAILCGFFIGLERNRRQKEAGIRTHMILALGACLYMIISKYGFFDMIGIAGTRVGPSRVASQVVAGIGFLGGGVMYAKGDFVKGLTTAAGLWATTAIAMLIGTGNWVLGICCTVILITVQIVFHFLSPSAESATPLELTFTIFNEPNSKGDLNRLLESWGVDIKSYNIVKKKGNLLAVELIVADYGHLPTLDILQIIMDNSYIKSISF